MIHSARCGLYATVGRRTILFQGGTQYVKHFEIYACGTMIGLTPEQYESWREEALHLFDAYSTDRYVFDLLIPARGEKHLAGRKLAAHIEEDEIGLTPLNNDRAVFSRDQWDVRRADLVICNLVGATLTEPSTGSKMEMAWAFQQQTPIILVIEAERTNPHEHLFISAASMARVSSVEDAVRLAVELLVPNKWRFAEVMEHFRSRMAARNGASVRA